MQRKIFYDRTSLQVILLKKLIANDIMEEMYWKRFDYRNSQENLSLISNYDLMVSRILIK